MRAADLRLPEHFQNSLRPGTAGDASFFRSGSGVLVENASDDFPQQKKLENLLPNVAGSSLPISPKTSPTSLWKSPVLIRLGILEKSTQELRNARPTTGVQNPELPQKKKPKKLPPEP